MGANMQKMMKQMQKMQKDMEKMQAEAAEKTVSASAGGGAVTITVSGNQEIKGININPDAVDLDDIEMLEDMIMAAANEALEQSKEMMTSELSKLTGGMNIPGLF
ncbi:MAG TPA: YbaB/EbfC family nucleoid-associated protein [Clostridiales bacterium]|nr:YbaB/EbfC family nucleoid-associated protein [Clostridiales bacterium]